MKNILVLTFGRKSNDNQSITLAKNLSKGGRIYIKKMLFNVLITLPNFILKFLPPWISVKKSDSFFDVENCDVIISCGRRTLQYARFLKKNNFPNAKLIQILNPDTECKDIDLVLMPEHDKNFAFSPEKIVTYRGSLFESFDEKEIQESIMYFKNKIDAMKKPIISFVVGGSPRRFRYEKKFVTEFVEHVVSVSKNMNATLLVITSRRTDNFIIEILRNKIESPNLLFVFDPRNDINPFLSFIHMSDYNIVTPDSISMCSELTTLKKPLYIIRPNEVMPAKYEHFYNAVIEFGSARFLDRSLMELETFKTENINNIKDIIKEIESKIDLKN